MPDTESSPFCSPVANAASQRSLRILLGKVIKRGGELSLPLGIGAVLGFYAADQGMRWLPTMLESVLCVFILAFLAMPLGRSLQGRAYRDTPERRKLRKRLIACLVLATVAVFVRLLVYWSQQPSTLTQLSRPAFDLAFEIDSQRYRELDRGLENAVAFLESQRDMFDPTSADVLTADQEKVLLDTWRTIYDYAFTLDQVRIFYEDWYRFDPSRAQRSFHLRSYLLTYAAELALYEKSTRLVKLLSANENAEKFLDTPHPSHDLPENTLGNFRQELQGLRDQARVIAGEQYLAWLDKGLGGRTEARSAGCAWLWEKVEGHLAMIRTVSPMDRSTLTLGSDLQALKQTIRRNWYPAQSSVARWMGDTRLRRIGNYLITEAQQEEMAARLLPGDILLTRKNWYLSNVGLPGFWPHAILYIGDPAKFDAYFDDPDVTSHFQQLSPAAPSLRQYLASRHPLGWARFRAGGADGSYCVIEAISEGVVLNTMHHAAGDYMAALRPNLTKLAKAQAVVEAFVHIEKPYDFDFDFATDHALVCTELVWRSYRPAEGKAGLDFPLSTVMGRRTLPANDIAKLFAMQRGTPDAETAFVFFLDAREGDRTAFAASEEAFVESCDRTKWDFALD